MLKKLLQKAFSLIHPLEKNQDYRNSILIVGSGRSGTTWLSQLINSRNQFRYIFEPFHSFKVKECADFSDREFLNDCGIPKTKKEVVHQVLTGNIQNRWVNSFNRKLISQRRLIKTIRAFFMLPWIQKNYPELPIIYILRNPVAVAASRIKHHWDNELDITINKEKLEYTYFYQFKDIIYTAQTDFEKHILIWCMENAYALKRCDRSRLCLIRYEDLYEQTEEVFKQINNYLGQTLKDLDQSTIAKPSFMSGKGNVSFYNKDKHLEAWKSKITKEELAFSIKALKRFELDLYYNLNDEKEF